MATSDSAASQQHYRDRKGSLLNDLRLSLDRDPDCTDWLALSQQLNRLAGVATQLGETELGEESRQLEEKLKLAAEPHRCQAALRRAWPNLERAA